MTIPDYEGMLEKFYRGLLKPGDVCIDVGAHTGRHAIPMAQCVGPKGSVHAFEPLPHIRAQLEQQIAQRDPARGRIFVSGLALGDREQDGVEFVWVEEFPEYSGLQERVYDHPVTRKSIRVEMRRLDSMCDAIPPVRFLKIDAEGAEYLILRGAEGLIQRDRPIVSFECGDNGLVHYAHTSGDIYDLFAGHGYRIVDILGRPHNRDSFVRATAEQRLWDYTALPD